MKKNHIIDSIIDSGLIVPGQVIIIGASGGPDSLCLLHALNSISDMYDLSLVPVHVNHMLRPEAYEESDHLADICERMDLECRFYEAPCSEIAAESGMSTEEAGRFIRYSLFDEVAEDLEAAGVPAQRIVIALGHNADDQAETVLFRLIRGTGPHGLAGIPMVRYSESGYMIVRPLLNIPRRDIEEYIKENKLRPNIDKSNDDNTYTRNRIRNELIPYLEENFNPQIRDNLRRYANLAYMDDSLLRDIAFGEYADHINFDADTQRAELDITGLRDDPPSITSRIVGLVLDLLGLEDSTSYETVTSIMELIYNDHPSAGVDLPLGIRAFREYDKLIFAEEEPVIRPDESLEIYPHIIMAKDFRPDEDMLYAAFDFDKFDSEYPGRTGDIVLRTRREGDFLPMRKGNKKIQDLLVDSKVKRSARESILLVAIDSEVLWVLPSEYFAGGQERTKGRFSPKFHIDDTTERVLFIELGESM